MGNVPYSVKGSEKDEMDILHCFQVLGNLHNLVLDTRI